MADINDIIIKAAAGETADFSAYTMAQKLLWYQANALYTLYRKGAISKNAGADMKKAIIAEYRQNSTLLENGSKAFMHLSAIYTGTEQAISAYRKNRTLENADRICSIIDGVPVKET